MALPQPLHIFRKDLIHLWPETLFVLILFVGFAFAAPSGWSGSQYAGYITLLALLIKILMPISWLVLIARAIQDESLVGDRQFWTSRPYHWAKLLAAKAILIVTCIYVPFFIMQCYLLKHAGLHPMLVIPALLHNLLLLTVVLIIPLAALSAVTSTFPRVLLAFIGAIIYILILLAITFWATMLQMPTPHLDWVLNSIFIVLPAIALILQYKTRQTMTARIILAATPLIAVLVLFLTPRNAIIAHSFPALSGPSAPALTGLSAQFHPKTAPTGHLATVRNFVEIGLPVGVSSVAKDYDFMVHGIRATITGGGVSYTSPYIASPLQFGQPNPQPVQFNSDQPLALLKFNIPEDVFNKIRSTPVDVHLDLAAEQIKVDKPSTWHATLLPFSVPGNGICSFPPDSEPNQLPSCRYPLSQPEISFVSAPLAAASCSSPAAQPVTGEASVGARGTSLDFDPVITVPLGFRTGDPNPQHNYVLCPGTALTFVEATTLPNATLTFDQKQVILDPFAARFQERTPEPAQQQ
jgi:hypothetical protein